MTSESANAPDAGSWGVLVLDEFDPDEAASHVNEVMIEDDARDPYLESYQELRPSV